MKCLGILPLLLGIACHAQHITIHVIDDGTLSPLKGVSVLLRKDCQNPNRPKALVQKTDSSGQTVFSSVSLSKEPICINLSSTTYRYAKHTLDVILVTPDQAERYKSLNPIATTLPAIETFHVQKRSFFERLAFIFHGD
jgi:hypothetical protein